MRKSIYDILGKKIDYYNEYEKLYEMFNEDKVIDYGIYHYSWAGLFEKFIEYWDYRNVYTTVDEILDYLELSESVSDGENVIEKILLLIDLILNVCEFVKYKQREHFSEFHDLGNDRIKLIYIKSDILLQNIDIILKDLGYKKIKKDKYKIMLMKDKADPIVTALTVEDESIANLILDYNDFRIENDLKAKKDILNSLGQYIEPLRKEIKQANSSLEDYIFFCLNKLHIRHNNKSGKDKINYVANIKKKDLINWYDKVYDLILLAIRLVEMPNYFKDFKELKKKIIEDETVKE
ncbi:MAG: hypothetical protein ACI4XR_01415 [Bacilli bacterium]